MSAQEEDRARAEKEKEELIRYEKRYVSFPPGSLLDNAELASFSDWRCTVKSQYICVALARGGPQALQSGPNPRCGLNHFQPAVGQSGLQK